MCFDSNCNVQSGTVLLVFFKLLLHIPGVASLAKCFLKVFFTDISIVLTGKGFDTLQCPVQERVLRYFSEVMLTLHQGEY